MMLTILASCGKADDIVSTSTSSSPIVAQETSTPAEPTLSEETADEPVVLGQWFVEYNESYLGESENTVLFFHSAGCGTCRATEASLKETGVTNGATVLKVDFDADENFELRKKYGVTKYHTFVQVDADGNEIKKWSGSLSDADIQEQLETSLEENISEEVADEVAQSETQEEPTVLAGKFTDYSEDMLGGSENTVLFFHSAGCGTCRATEASLKETGVANGATVLKVDFDADENFELRKKYGVTKYHTFVQVDADGNEIKKWSGSLSDADIQEQLKKN